MSDKLSAAITSQSKHKTDRHAANKELYDIDCLHSKTPGIYWQGRFKNCGNSWCNFSKYVLTDWDDNIDYRRKPDAPVWPTKQPVDMIVRLTAFMHSQGMKRGRTERETLYLNGWTVGDILEGYKGGRKATILITAIGWNKILVLRFDYDKKEFMCECSTTLCAREWRKIGRQK